MGELIVKEEQKAAEAIQLMVAIVGNSKNIKMVQHFLVMTASRGLKGDMLGARGLMNSVKAILDNVKINKDLYKS